MLLFVGQDQAHGDVLDLREEIERRGLRTRVVSTTQPGSIIRCTGSKTILTEIVGTRDDVSLVDAMSSGYPLVARCPGEDTTVVTVPSARPVRIGGRELVVIAGPCSVESRSQMLSTALGVRSAGACALRGGAFKPRTSPYPFQGLGTEGLELLAEAREETGLPVVTEVIDPRLVESVAEVADVLQVGARNMQNYPLLDELGRVQRPVLLKRGPSATLEELLLAAERIVLRGNDDVILCERGIRTYETATRNTLDVSAIPVLRERTHLPVIVDPSHAAGRSELVEPLALAGIAAGADGLLVEVHAQPEAAITDARQALSLEMFERLMNRVSLVGQALGRPTRSTATYVGAA